MPPVQMIFRASNTNIKHLRNTARFQGASDDLFFFEAHVDDLKNGEHGPRHHARQAAARWFQ